MTAAAVLCDVTFEVVDGDRDDTGDRVTVLYVILPDDDRTRFGCALTPEAAAGLARSLQDAAGVSPAPWLPIGLS